ncbi:FAD-binding oxidoreductase [Aspergillus saccharolyticus JOP 1030-1]|uniref:6-hydroxy-D-nicotine oxidase n=1 Tax=Aspergillus saccharolyticus JOP 1030-1 TaxID=1450539 RepID=A0A318ZEZ2_9EURO|nr:6-hydroxy-D-nicotine oxidase [Aspergillus saccharolyticus JOP 1030-1]PYH45989.1 6-hydroxy-D-nicotine oxidase [Aspergillus saccharolyticus JOP 1030-1]
MNPSAATILSSAQLDDKGHAQLQALLSAYTALSEADKHRQKGSHVSQAFAVCFPHHSVAPGASGYESQRRKPWSTNCWLQPQVIVSPSSAPQVATALALCRFFHVPFSIRGGGRLQIPGFTSNEGGVVISLSQCNQVELSDDKSVARIGVGLRWLEVYRRLEAHGLVVAGGRVPEVGVSGLLLGGGISFQNSQYGLGAMNVCNYEVVLADARIVHANAHENSDLFWALKGGGPNYGIVTRMDMRTIPNQIWAAVQIYPPTASEQLLDALMHYHEAIETDNKATLIWNATPQFILIVFVYCAPVERPTVFAPFDEIPPVATFVPAGVRSVYDLVQAVAAVNEAEPSLHEFRTMSSRPDINVYRAIQKAHAEQAEALKEVEGLTLTAVIQPMSSLAMQVSANSPLGLEMVGQQWFLARADWKHAHDAERVRQAVRSMVDAAEAAAREHGVYLPYKYSNYAARDQNPLASYGERNVRRLGEIARVYDPDAVFQVLQNGGWLLADVGV